MIVNLADKVCSQLIELDQRKKSAAMNQAMTQTLNELLSLSTRVEKLTSFIQLNQKRIVGLDRERLIGGMKNIITTVQLYQSNFKEERRQVPQLKQLGNAVDTELYNAKSAWSTAFKSEMEPIFQATTMAVRLLPTDAQNWLQQLQDSVNSFILHPPTSFNEVASMVQKVESLKNYTQTGISKYGPAISQFLTKVQKGDATLHDLNREILLWIKEQDLYKKFKISFNQ